MNVGQKMPHSCGVICGFVKNFRSTFRAERQYLTLFVYRCTLQTVLSNLTPTTATHSPVICNINKWLASPFVVVTPLDKDMALGRSS